MFEAFIAHEFNFTLISSFHVTIETQMLHSKYLSPKSAVHVAAFKFVISVNMSQICIITSLLYQLT